MINYDLLRLISFLYLSESNCFVNYLINWMILLKLTRNERKGWRVMNFLNDDHLNMRIITWFTWYLLLFGTNLSSSSCLPYISSCTLVMGTLHYVFVSFRFVSVLVEYLGSYNYLFGLFCFSNFSFNLFIHYFKSLHSYNVLSLYRSFQFHNFYRFVVSYSILFY